MQFNALISPREANTSKGVNRRQKGVVMDTKKGSLLVGAGFLLGTLGVKALTSEPAKKCYVQGIVEEAKAQVDDIVAEATYLTEGETAEEETVEEEIEEAEKAEGAE